VTLTRPFGCGGSTRARCQSLPPSPSMVSVDILRLVARRSVMPILGRLCVSDALTRRHHARGEDPCYRG